MSIPDEITSLKREIARLKAELKILESCLEGGEDSEVDQDGEDRGAGGHHHHL